MERMLAASLVILATLGFVGWLGGGRKWAFRTMLTAVILAGLGVAGVLLYSYGTDRAAEHRTQKIHNCAIAKVAAAKCTASTPQADLPKGSTVRSQTDKPWADYAQHPNEVIWDVCPPYWLPDTPTSEQENAAVAAAEEECAGEIDPKHKPLHEQLVQYRRDHGIVQEANKSNTADAAVPHGSWEKYAVRKLNSKECAAKVRSSYPGAYDDLDDATLTKKVLAKYPAYCDVPSSPPNVVPALKDIR